MNWCPTSCLYQSLGQQFEQPEFLPRVFLGSRWMPLSCVKSQVAQLELGSAYTLSLRCYVSKSRMLKFFKPQFPH